MKAILVPSKTYNLYVAGWRTFIHVPKDQELAMQELKYGEVVRIVNQENEAEFIEQIFWFLYSFKEIERFIFLSFKCEVKSPLHWKRMNNAQKTLRSSSGLNPYKIYVEKGYQKYLYHQIMAYSSFFFITDDISMPVSQLIYRATDSKNHQNDLVDTDSIDTDAKNYKNFIVINELRIKTGPNLEEILNVYSMIPLDLLYI